MRRNELLEFANEEGLHFFTWSPGDNVRRYRFVLTEEMHPDQTYGGPHDGIFTALGPKEAKTFIEGFRLGRGYQYDIDKISCELCKALS